MGVARRQPHAPPYDASDGSGATLTGSSSRGTRCFLTATSAEMPARAAAPKTVAATRRRTTRRTGMGSCTTHPLRGCSIGASCCARSWHCARRQGSPRPARVQGAAAACTAHWRVCQLPCVRARRGERAPSDRDGCEAVGRSAVQASAVPSAVQAVQTDGALYTRAAHQLHHLCDDLEMRHKTSVLPGALVYEQCTALVAEHFGVLHGVLEAWPLIYLSSKHLSFPTARCPRS